MELTTADAGAMIELAFDRMLATARALGERVTERPDLPGSNSVSGLIAHGIGVTEWWLGHEALGYPTSRNRDAEFESRLGVSELEPAVDRLRERLPAMLAAIDLTDGAATARPEGVEPAWTWTPTGMFLHVIEELFQHAGHADITADLLRAGEERPSR